MRNNGEIILYTKVTQVPDDYGGRSNTLTVPKTYGAYISIKSNDLSPKPSGLGYYRIITVMIEKNILNVKDVVEHNNVKYNITRKVLCDHSFLDTFIGYEV